MRRAVKSVPPSVSAQDQKFKAALDNEWKAAVKGRQTHGSDSKRRRPKTANDFQATRRNAARRAYEKIQLKKDAIEEKKTLASECAEEERLARLGAGKYQQSRADARDRLRIRREMMLKARNVEVRELMGAGNEMSSGSGSEFQSFLKAAKKTMRSSSLGSPMSEQHKRRLLGSMSPEYIFNPSPGEHMWMPAGIGKKPKSPLNRQERRRADRLITGMALLPDFVEDYYNPPNTMSWEMTAYQ